MASLIYVLFPGFMFHVSVLEYVSICSTPSVFPVRTAEVWVWDDCSTHRFLMSFISGSGVPILKAWFRGHNLDAWLINSIKKKLHFDCFLVSRWLKVQRFSSVSCLKSTVVLFFLFGTNSKRVLLSPEPDFNEKKSAKSGEWGGWSSTVERSWVASLRALCVMCVRVVLTQEETFPHSCGLFLAKFWEHFCNSVESLLLQPEPSSLLFIPIMP